MENFERIERYLKDKMSPEERQAFDQELSSDQALREELAYQRLEEEFLELAIREGIRKELEAVHLESMQDDKTTAKFIRLNKNYRRIVAIAGLLLLALIAGLLYNSWNQSPARIAELEHRAYSPLKVFNLSQNRKGPVSEDQDSDVTLSLMLAGELDSAILKLERQMTQNADNMIFPYLLASAYFEKNRYGESAILFRKVENNAEASLSLRHWAEYYRLLCLMKTGNKSDYLLMLGKIKNKGSSHPFYPRVIEIEDKILR